MATSGVAAARQAITRLQGVVKEAVHVKIHPRPRNLAESREVLRILQQYGEIAMYKHLKYESVAPAHNTVLAIYRDATSAQKLIDASPVTFELRDGKITPRPLQRNIADLVGAAEEGRDGKEGNDDDVRPQESQIINDHELQDASGQVSVGDAAAFQGTDGSLKQTSTSSSTSNPQTPDSPAANADPKNKDFLAHILTPNSPPPPPPSFSPSQPSNPTTPSQFPSIPTIASLLQPPPPPPRPPRQYQLTISPSNLDHEKYIERQGYFGGFHPDTNSIMAEDLEGRVPLQGLVDCQIRRPEAPARVVAKWRGRAAQRTTTLMELWERGRKERGEV